MTRNRRAGLTVTLFALPGLLIPLASCAHPSGPQRPQPAAPVFQPAKHDDGGDCDAEDRRKNELPDCGFLLNGKFVAYSWVKAGKTRAPHGWDRSREIAKARLATRRR